MKTHLIFLITALIHAGSLAAPPPSARQLPSLMPTLEFVLRHGDEIGLTSAQRTKLEEETRDLEAQAQKLSDRVRDESDLLAALLAREAPDAPAVALQFDKVLAQENEVKRTRLKISLLVRAALTPEQQKNSPVSRGVARAAPRRHPSNKSWRCRWSA